MKFAGLLLVLFLTAFMHSFQIISKNAVLPGVLLANGTSIPFTKLCCFMNSGYEQVTLEYIYNSQRWISSTDIGFCNGAQLAVDILVYPYPYSSVTDQVANIFTSIESARYGMIWVSAEVQSTFKPSCNFLGQMVNGISQKGKTVGIRSSKESWAALFGTDGCADLLKRPLWNNATEVFGGWTKNTRVSLNQTQIFCSYNMPLYN